MTSMSENEYDARRMSKQDRADPKMLFMQQVTRCLQTVGSPLFGPNVEGLFRMLPTASFMLLQDQNDVWNYPVGVYEYENHCGIRVGSKDNPLIWNTSAHQDFETFLESPDPPKTVDGEIDWDSPRIVSPKLIEEPYTEYDVLFRMILTEAQNCGIWWTDVTGGVLNLPGGISEALKATKDKPRTPQ